MTSATRPIALIDTNILYSAGIRDILLQVAISELFEPKWSPDIRDELIDTFRKNRPDIDPQRIERIWTEMNHYFPKANITGYEYLIDDLDLPDPDDRHVLAAAIHATCGYIVTENRKHFPDATLEIYGITKLRPDDFFLMLFHSDLDEFIDAVRMVIARLTNPPYSVEEYLDKRMQDSLSKTVAELRIHAHLLS